MSRNALALAAVVVGALTASVPAAIALPTETAAASGVTSRTVKIGTTMPLSGPASLYAPIATGMRVYFSHINSRRDKRRRRGVHGRQIQLIVRDDQYNPAQTVQLTRQLVERDRVFALVGGLGTEPQQAVRAYLNQRRVPQLYVSTGATMWGAQHKQFPWTIGWQPDYDSIGFAFGNYIKRFDPRARIAVLLQNDDYGKDYLRGFERGLRGGNAQIVAREAYEVGTPSVAPHVSRLRQSGATVFAIFAIPQPTIQALVVAHRLGWRPTKYVNDVSATDTFLTLAQNAAGSPDATRGVITATYLKDPASPKYEKDRTVRLYKRLMAKYAPGANVNNALHFYGMAKAHTFVTALRRAGRNPTRGSLMRAAVNMRVKSPWLLRGTQIRSSRRSAFPISTVRLTRWEGQTFVEFGRLIKTRG